MTDDKVPTNAPIWYQLGVNASFAGIVCVIVLYKQFTDPSVTEVAREAAMTSEKLIDRVLIGQDKMLDKQERIQDKAEKNNAEIREIFRNKAANADLRAERFEFSCTQVVEAFKTTVDRAEKYHEASKTNQDLIRKILEATKK